MDSINASINIIYQSSQSSMLFLRNIRNNSKYPPIQGCMEFLMKLFKSVGEEVVKRERECHVCGGKRVKGKQYHLPYNIKAVGKNITWKKGKGKAISSSL